MILVYGISRWTNASRASARHIDNGGGKPLCNDKRKVFSWEKETGEPTCQKCVSLYNKLKFGVWQTPTQRINEYNSLRVQNKLH